MKFTLYSKPEYFAELKSQIDSCKKDDSIYLMAMAFRPHFSEISDLVRSLCEAAERGAKVQLIFDTTTFETGRTKWVNARRAAKHDLEDSGVKVSLVNRRQAKLSNPYSGRLHAKISIINDQIFVGGCNLNQVDQIDLMASWKDSGQANQLAGVLDKIIASGSARSAFEDRDLVIQIDNQTKMIFDAGVPHQSLIYDLALQAIDESSKSVFAALYFFPTGKTFRRLQAAAKRGVKVRLLHNRPARYELVYRLIYTAVAPIGRRRLHKSVLAEELAKGLPLMHVKLLTADKTTILGSHNLAPSGVNWGTAETAIISTDPKFGHASIEAVKAQLNALTDLT